MDSKPQPASSISANRTEHDRRVNEKLRRELGPVVCDLLEVDILPALKDGDSYSVQTGA